MTTENEDISMNEKRKIDESENTNDETTRKELK